MRNKKQQRLQRTWSYRCKEYFRRSIAFLFTNVGIIGLVIAYTMAGSFMFMAIEKGSHPYDIRLKEVRKMRNETAAKLWSVICCEVFNEQTWKNSVTNHLVTFQGNIVREVLHESYEGEKDPTEQKEPWSFSGSFLFSLSVITSIGYGNLTPRTDEGKLATILYAMAGMPLFLLYLSNIGSLLAITFKFLYAKCYKLEGCMENTEHVSSKQIKGKELKVKLEEKADNEDEGSSTIAANPRVTHVPFFPCLALMVTYVCSGAFLFAESEKLGFLDASYFCFISLSTIGFGDIIPKHNTSFKEVQPSFIFCSMYLLLGMALIAMCFNLMQEEVLYKVRNFGKALKKIILCKICINK